MTQDSHTDGNEPSDQSGDNELIRSLREQIKEKDKELKGAPTRESLEAEIRTELERESAISEQLVALGHPTGLSEFLKGKLGEEAEVTRESVAEALQSIGYQVEDSDAAPQPEGDESSSQSDLAKVTNLSSQVRATAQGDDPSDLTKKINAAETQEDLTRLAEEGGFLTAS